MKDEKKPSPEIEEKADTIIHEITVKNEAPELPMKKTLIIFALVIVGGIISGFAFSYISGASSESTSVSTGTDKQISDKKDVVESAGIADKETFKDSAEGELEDGGHESGEGSFKLIRPGGDDQTAYLTSSTVDLTEFVGKKVRVYGETFSSQQVSWLMDVGFVEVLE